MNRIIRQKNENYTIISNVCVRDKRLSMKAKGMMSIIMSLPDDWDFSIQGLSSIVKEGKTAIYAAISELKDCGYCQVISCRDEKGKIIGNDYTFFEESCIESPSADYPNTENPNTENPNEENPNFENQPQINKEIEEIKNKENKDINICSKKNVSRFVKPTIEDVNAYVLEKGYHIDAESFVNYYDSKGWVVGKSPMKDWHAAVRTWEKTWKENHPQQPNDIFSGQQANGNNHYPEGYWQ